MQMAVEFFQKSNCNFGWNSSMAVPIIDFSLNAQIELQILTDIYKIKFSFLPTLALSW